MKLEVNEVLIKKEGYMVIPGLQKQACTIENATDIAVELFGISKEKLRSGKRDRPIVEVRMLLFYFLFHKHNYTCVRIGNYFNKDHSSVSYCTKTVKKLIEVDYNFREKFNLMNHSL